MNYHSLIFYVFRHIYVIKKNKRRKNMKKETTNNQKQKCKNCTKYFRDAHNLCYLAEIDVVNGDSEACEKFVQAVDEEEYVPSATNGDYSPSSPWLAPGMSISDFI